MKIKYFEDTDTALFEFTDQEVKETREITEDIYIDLDADGKLVSMTIEYAAKNIKVQDFSFQRIIKESA